MKKYDCLKLENQLCFPLYACAKEVSRKYKPMLDELDLTYTQYLVMMVLWDRQSLNVKELGAHLYLDSGTLTPVLKKLEKKGYVSRERSTDDERNLSISITEEGKALRDRALSVPGEMSCYMNLTEEEAGEMYRLLYKLLNGLDKN